MENKVIDKAIERFICVYDENASSGYISHRLETLLEEFLNIKNDYTNYIIFDIDKDYVLSKSPQCAIKGKEKYLVAVGRYGNVVMGAY